MNLEPKVEEKMHEYMENMLYRISDKIKNRTVSPRDFPFILNIYPIVKKHFNVGAEWDEFAYEICRYYKYEIEKNRIEDLSVFSGLGYIADGISCFSNYTNQLITFSNQVNELLYNKLEQQSELLYKNSIMNMREYDIIGGVSGIALYLSRNYNKHFPNTTKYLCSLFDRDKDNNINLRVSWEDQYLENEKIEFPEGNINFGLSHGIVGPLLALSQIYKNVKEPNLGSDILESIKVGLKIYEKFSYMIDEAVKWPSQLDYRKFNRGLLEECDIYSYPSWCYGSVSIANSINRICKTTNIKFNGHSTINMKKQTNELSQSIEKKDVCLCHGIAGEILFLSLLDDANDICEKIESMLDIIRENWELEYCYKKMIFSIFNLKTLSVYQGHPENLNILEGGGGIFLLFSKLLYNESKIEELLFLK